jgi:membrane dipeptidase
MIVNEPANPPIFDGHNDTLLDLYLPKRGKERTFFVESQHGHIDLPRARRGGFGGGFFAIYVPNPAAPTAVNAPISLAVGAKMGKSSYRTPLPDPLEQSYALNFAMGMAAKLFEVEAQSNGEFKIVRTVGELTEALKNGVVAAIFHFEGVEPLDTDLHALDLFYQAGLRSLGIVWSRPNAFGHGVPFNFPSSPDTGPGLTDAGRALVKRCNQLGVLIDLSHLNERGFWDVAELSAAPLVATHSGVHALCPSPRNLTDRQLDAIGETGGVVGVNFHIGFLRTDGRTDLETSVSEIARHAAYIADRIGIDHVALGSDFDGATMPHDLKDVAGLPVLVQALRHHGFDDTSLRKIAHENWLRVLGRTWKS